MDDTTSKETTNSKEQTSEKSGDKANLPKLKDSVSMTLSEKAQSEFVQADDIYRKIK